MIRCSSEKKERHYTSTISILEGRPISFLGLHNYPNGKLKYLVDSLEGRNFGNFFEFSKNSSLKSYSFMIDSLNLTYRELFDSMTHKLINVQGTPIVYRTIDADSYQDSISVEYLISDFSYENLELSLSENGIDFQNFLITPHRVLKFIGVVRFSKNITSVNRFYLLARLKATVRKTNISKIFLDTIDLTKSR